MWWTITASGTLDTIVESQITIPKDSERFLSPARETSHGICKSGIGRSWPYVIWGCQNSMCSPYGIGSAHMVPQKRYHLMKDHLFFGNWEIKKVHIISVLFPEKWTGRTDPQNGQANISRQHRYLWLPMPWLCEQIPINTPLYTHPGPGHVSGDDVIWLCNKGPSPSSWGQMAKRHVKNEKSYNAHSRPLWQLEIGGSVQI